MIKPDNISFLSTLPNYINIGNPTGSFTISGTLPDSTVQTFGVTIGTSRNNTRFDIYGVNQNTNLKQLLSNTTFPVIYQNAGGEVTNLITSYSETSVTVNFQLSNFTGSPITLTNQTILITVVEYQIPY